MKSLFALITLVSGTAFAAPVPAAHEMNCWDHTFAYNRLAVVEKAGVVNLTISGQNLEVFTALTGEKGWGEIYVKAAFPSAACLVGDSDVRIMRCQADVLELEVELTMPRPKKSRIIKLENAVIIVKKTLEVGDVFSPGEHASYELAVKTYTAGEVTKFTQAYGMFSDPNDACKLK